VATIAAPKVPWEGSVVTDRFIDLTGWHVNVILGTVFVDRDQFASSAVSTWGLWYAGKHPAKIKRVVQEWCRQNRES